VYQVSRSLYRRLVPHVPIALEPETAEELRTRLLDACEMTVRRVEAEPDFARPERYLFEQVRTYFPFAEQPVVRKLIDIHMDLARQLREQMPPERSECAAFTRQGTPCRREPRPGSEYCPSHRHLEALATDAFGEGPA
jgi:hypothetical protein